MRTLWALLGAGLLLVCVAPAAAARSLRIETMDVALRVDAQAVLHVEERIVVRFEGSWNGIFRRIPYAEQGRLGIRQTIALDLEAVEDGAGNDLEYETKRTNGNLSVKIRVPGASDAARTIVLRYRALNAIRSQGEDDSAFGGHDEIYWNAVGPDWEMPIAALGVTLDLPASVRALPAASIRTRSFTGPYGATNNGPALERTGDGLYRLAERPALRAHEAFTVVVGIPPGHLEHPGRLRMFLWWIRANFFVFLPFVALLFWVLAWWFRGRDTLAHRTIIPEFEAPFDLGPAEVGVLLDDRLDRRDITAAIVHLAVQGVLTIHDEGKGGDWRLTLDPARRAKTKLSTFEKRLLDSLFEDEAVEVKLGDLQHEFHKDLSKLRTSVLSHLVSRRFFPRRPDKVAESWGGYATLVLLGLVVLGWFAHWPLPYWVAMVLAGVGMYVVSRHMPRRTARGLDALARIRGLQEYMVTAEKQRMASLPLETFERLLPYAIAFGLHERWVAAFGDLYTEPPGWYAGGADGWNAGMLGGRLSQLEHSVGSNLYAAPRGTSGGSSGGWGGGYSGGSGFSGGGFSGGGFGGGGGGGW